MRVLNWILVSALGLSSAAGCSDSPCEAFGASLCDKACDCTDGDGCQIAQAGGGFTISFDTKSDCRFFYVSFGCPREVEDSAFEACTEALDSASCVDTGDGTMAIELPDLPECTDSL